MIHLSRQADIEVIGRLIDIKYDEYRAKRRASKLALEEMMDLVDLSVEWRVEEENGRNPIPDSLRLSAEGQETLNKVNERSETGWQILRELALLNVTNRSALKELQFKTMKFLMKFDPEVGSMPSIVLSAYSKEMKARDAKAQAQAETEQPDP